MAKRNEAAESTQIVAPAQQAQSIETLFKVNMPAMAKAAPRNVGDPARLIRIAFNTIFYDEKLRKCTHKSLLAGVMESLKLGLALGGPMQEAWLVPFNVKQPNGGYQMEATFMVGYQGYRNLIDRAKSVMDMQPQLVYQNDYFEAELSEQKLIHRPWWLCGAAEPGDVVAAYVMAHLRGGGKQLTLLPRTDIEAHRNRSRAKDSGPWVTDFGPMALKTVVRVAAKYLPKASEAMQLLSRALELDDRADRGDGQWGDFDPAKIGVQVFDLPPAEQKPALEALKDKLSGGAPAATAPAEAMPPSPAPGAPATPPQDAPGASSSPSPDGEGSDVVRGLFED
jgi:recombination protein RecT